MRIKENETETVAVAVVVHPVEARVGSEDPGICPRAPGFLKF